MKNILIASALIGIFNNAYSQNLKNLSIGFENNTAWYLDDNEAWKTSPIPGTFFDPDNLDSENNFRANSYLKLDYNFLDNFTASIQMESYESLALLNYSPNFVGTNLGTYSINYRNKSIDATLGHYYEQFGSGLILRSWEDRQLGINNALFGGKISYDLNNIRLTALYGKQRSGFDLSEGEIYGFNSELDISKILNFKKTLLGLGLSYVGRLQAKEQPSTNFEDLTNALSGRFDISYRNMYGGMEYVYKSKDAISFYSGQINSNFVKPGNAFLINTGFSKKGLGVDLTLRRLENMGFFSERKKAGNEFNENLINYTPGLTKQHDYLLTNIFVYQSQYTTAWPDPQIGQKSGEIGGQLDLFYKIKKGSFLGGKYGTKIAFNAAYWAGLKGDYDFENNNYDSEFFGFGTKYFSDFSLEVRKKWNSNWRSIFYYVNQFSNQREIENNPNLNSVSSDIFVVESTHRLGRGKSIRIEGQRLSSDSKDHDWYGGTLEYNFNSKLSFYLNDIYNNGEDKNSKKTHYFNLGGSYTKGATRVGINYGRQRGGLLCVGGVCRVVSEATGLTMNIVMAF
jgi:hypothetical protein